MTTETTVTIELQPDRDDFEAAAATIGCDLAAVYAVTEVEAPRGAFEPDVTPPRPTLLFERHYFHKLTAGRFDNILVPGLPPDVARISSPNMGGYGRYSDQHVKLALAATLCREVYGTHDAAMKSASWGLFQIMGLFFDEAGHTNVQSFVNAMYAGADHHLRAFVNLVDARRLDVFLRHRQWEAFAERYNGKAYRVNKYHIRLGAAYAKWSARLKAEKE